MKIITIGDLHGSTAWKFINPQDWDHMIFIGDYVDSFDSEDEDILKNLLEVIELKKKEPEKVILLWGNHDIAYLFKGESPHGCSGFRYSLSRILYEQFSWNRYLFQTAWQAGNYLWSHAGIVKQWYTEYASRQVLPADLNLAGTLNRLFEDYYLPLFYVSSFRGGMEAVSGPFWADLTETVNDPLTGFHQIVGHTHTREGIMAYRHPDGITSVIYTDCLETKAEFYQLNL